MSQHTPGPWEATNIDQSDAEHYDVHNIEHGGPGWMIARLSRDVPDAQANARLIAAAPDMLAALKNIAANLDPSGKPVSYFGIQAAIDDSIRRARAVIARAEGGQ